MPKFNTYRISDLEQKLKRMGARPLDIMAAGVTGAGKSTTLNAFFQRTVATVGTGVDPETMEVADYELNDWFRIWDTPGLGDGVLADQTHKKKMIDLLNKTYKMDGTNYGFIDLVLVIIEGANRDMGTTYSLINEVLIPNIQKERILVVINQADVGMKGRHWNICQRKPDNELLGYLENKTVSIQRRVKEATGVSILKPVYYSAKYGYRVNEVFDFIIDNIPSIRRPMGGR